MTACVVTSFSIFTGRQPSFLLPNRWRCTWHAIKDVLQNLPRGIQAVRDWGRKVMAKTCTTYNRR
jgi:hypothetical protein